MNCTACLFYDESIIHSFCADDYFLIDQLFWDLSVIIYVNLELITMVGGSMSDSSFGIWLKELKRTCGNIQMALGLKEAEDNSKDKAAARVSSDAGKWVRRIIVSCVLFAVILAPFILSILGYSTVVEVETSKSRVSFRIIR